MVDLVRGSAAARGLAGRTQGVLRSRLRSVVAGSDRLIHGLSARLETALSLSSGADSDVSGVSGVSAGGGCGGGGDGLAAAAGDGPGPAGDDSREASVASDSSGSRWSAERPLVASGPDPYDRLRPRLSDVATSESTSDADGYGPSTSLELSDDGRRPWAISDSEGSLRSVSSDLSGDSSADSAAAESHDYMKQFVQKLFSSSADITLEEKARFGELVRTEAGRAWFARFVNHERGRHRCVGESTFYSLVQYFALALFECGQAEDFGPAKSLMNMCFTFYHRVGNNPTKKQYLHEFLGQQSIWQSIRFWNAAFFDALQAERSNRPVPTRQQLTDGDVTAPADDVSYQQNITFGQLGTFTHNMFALGLPKDLCMEFLRKQSAIANLREDQLSLLRDNIDGMYSGSVSTITSHRS